MMDETSFSDEVKVRIDAHEVDVFHGDHSGDDVFAPLPNKITGTGYRNCRKSEQRDSDSSEDEVSEVAALNNEQNKPLLYPRHHRVKIRSGVMARGCLCHVVWRIASGVIAVALLASFAFFVVYFVHVLDAEVTTHKTTELIGCSKLVVEDVWVVGFPKLVTESALRLLDVNGDGVLDVLFGFATGAEGYNVPDIVCEIYFSGIHPCLGGLLAVDGASGRELWRHYSSHEIFAVNCNQDLDGDSLKDCIIAGRVGTFEAVSSRDGHLLWNFTDSSARVEVMNLYTGQFISDLNGDSIPDIINIHGGDPFGQPGSAKRLSGKILLFSGKDGKVLREMTVPDGRESYYSPVVYDRKDGTEVVLFGTGGETHPGSLWMITLSDLYKGKIQRAEKIYSNPVKGVMTPPVLIDLTADGVPDIVFATYNSTVLALNGETYDQLWNFTYPMSETYATPSPGFYNSDGIPDFMVHWQYGPGFPVYYHSVTTVVDGASGNAVVVPYVRSSMGAQTSPLTISTEGLGNDIFLYWNADCKDHEGEGGKFTFVKGTNIHEQSRSDFCRLRFKSEGVSRMYALNSHIRAPGFVVYDSEVRKEVEHQWTVNTTAEALVFLRNHPENMDDFRHWMHQLGHHPHNEPHSTGQSRLNILKDSHSQIVSSLHPLAYDRATANDGTLYDNRQALTTHGSDDDSDYENNIVHDDHRIFQDNWPHSSQYKHVRPHSDWSSYDQSDDMRPSPRSRVMSRHSEATSGEDVKFLRKTGSLSKSSKSKTAGIRKRATTFKNSSKQGSTRIRHKDGIREKMRLRRHVGPHDEGGLQRLISTGTLAPPLLHPSHHDYNNSIDVIFATYWFYPAKTKTLLPQDEKCIEQRMATQLDRFDPTSKYYGMDDDDFEQVVTDECLRMSGHQLPDNGTYQSQTMYTPYTVNMGQLTLYRLRLKCRCPEVGKDQRCSRILPFQDQQWSGYMGSGADSHWTARKQSTL